jgi:hypothetical protein
MSAINRIAYYQNRRDEVPNQELAHQLAESEDKAGIHEIAENLWNKNKNIRSDCLKVLYEIGYIRPDLIADYVNDFLKLLKDKENRMVWGAMIGLATIADLRPLQIWDKIDDVINAVDVGSLITVVWGVKTLAHIAKVNQTYHSRLFPILLTKLQTCIPRDVPMHAESMLVAVDKADTAPFLTVLEKRKPELTGSQLTRLNKVIKKVQRL